MTRRERRVERIVVVCPPEKSDEDESAAPSRRFGFATPIAFAPSGAERQDSTRNGLDSVPADCDIVFVHDAARPLILPGDRSMRRSSALVSADQAP
ncbi:MAG: 2-C-methyl-D-erythritol 4-phosphate cytidylyltransferase [Collinsella sp.]